MNSTYQNRKAFLLGIAIALSLATTSGAADWGSLAGRFVFDGKPGEPKAINVNKDVEYCGKKNLVEETVVVGKDGGLADVFVYLYLKRGKTTPIHPKLEKPSDKPVVLDNSGCRFQPHAMVVRVGQPFEVRNSDTVGHNTNASLFVNGAFNQMVASGTPLTKTFAKQESYPSPFNCNIHPWMQSHVLIRDNPYMAVSAADGKFEIKNLPAGNLEFTLWHGAKGNMKSMAVGKGKTSSKGRLKLTIAAGETLDLGDIKVKPAVLGL